MENYWKQAQIDNSNFNISGLVTEADELVELGNQMVMNLWTFYPEVYSVLTSNLNGYVFNPSLNPGNGIPRILGNPSVSEAERFPSAVQNNSSITECHFHSQYNVSHKLDDGYKCM